MGQRGSVFRHPDSRYYHAKFRGTDNHYITRSTGCETKQAALDWLNLRLGKMAGGARITRETGRLTLDDAFAMHIADLTNNGRRSATVDAPICHTSIKAFFPGSTRLADIGTPELREFAAARLKQGAARGSINKELGHLCRAFRLAREFDSSVVVPKIPRLAGCNIRKGFFERPEFEAVRDALPVHLRPIATFMFWTGWRWQSEVLPLTADRVDLDAGVVRLNPNETKTKEGRTFIFGAIPELRQVLAEQLADIEALKERDIVTAFVFHMPDGNRIHPDHVYGYWRKAVKAAGFPQRLLHDFRRTACRNLERAGVPRSVAMLMVGHKTEAIYRRYAIADEAMLREGSAKLAAFAEAMAVGRKKAAGQVRQFKKRA
jgi:integrase